MSARASQKSGALTRGESGTCESVASRPRAEENQLTRPAPRADQAAFAHTLKAQPQCAHSRFP
jgi:hypothetical protein